MTDPHCSNQAAGCPVDHNARKTARGEVSSNPAVSTDANGVWHVRGHDEVRAVLRSDVTKQAGFGAEMIAKMPSTMREPIFVSRG